MKALRLVFLLVIWLLSGCAGPGQKPVEKPPEVVDQGPVLSFDSDLFGERPADIIPVMDIYLLSEMQQKAFRGYFNHP